MGLIGADFSLAARIRRLFYSFLSFTGAARDDQIGQAGYQF
jgi:hypothetical protein